MVIKMYKSRIKIGNDVNQDFMQLYTTTWDRIHSETNVFRYKVENLRERIIDDKYILNLNTNRIMKRRSPQQIDNICQPFDENKFNFTKASTDETIFTLVYGDADKDEHYLLVNDSPISRYHSLLCPSMYKCLPQVVTKDSLQLTLDIMLWARDCNMKIAFNSLCGFASVNHLHYHIFIEKNILPIETVKCKHLKGPVYILSDEYPIPGFSFEVTSQTDKPSETIHRLINVLINKSIAHNIIFTFAQNVGDRDVVRVFILPRKSSSGVKQLAAFNVAALELSGWFILYDAESFEKLTSEELELELKKWKYNNFDGLCEDIKDIY